MNTLGDALHELVELGIIVKTGTYKAQFGKEMGLYLPCPVAAEERTAPAPSVRRIGKLPLLPRQVFHREMTAVKKRLDAEKRAAQINRRASIGDATP